MVDKEIADVMAGVGSFVIGMHAIGTIHLLWVQFQQVWKALNLKWLLTTLYAAFKQGRSTQLLAEATARREREGGRAECNVQATHQT